MADITMCGGFDCPLREDCLRFKAVPDMMQSYFSPPYDAVTGKCSYQVKIAGWGIRKPEVSNEIREEDSRAEK